MRDDALHGGQASYADCRKTAVADQGGLCAYCEIDIRDNDPLKCRVEHFHPKSDTSTTHNWALDWNNLLAACNGGTHAHVNTAGFHLEPMSDNLSCDAHKDRLIQEKKLNMDCDGWILHPLHIQAPPPLFRVNKSTGELAPDATGCAASPPWPRNRHASVEALVEFTIDALNLNCDRLIAARLEVVRAIEHGKKQKRDAGLNGASGLAALARQYFVRVWPPYFTTVCSCLGPAAETHLKAIAYQG
jgi:uncharacterized protein (TIGR02646 family)